MFSFKVYKTPKEVLVSVCDIEILGKELEEGFEVKEEFYGGSECEEDGLMDILGEATIINAVGNKVVEFLIREELVEEEKTIKIGDVLHAQVARL